MDIGSLFLVLGLALLVALYVFRPFFVRSSRSVNPEELQISMYLAEKERLITAIQELDLDHSLRKIPENEYPQQRSEFVSRAAVVIQKLDQLQKELHQTRADKKVKRVVTDRRSGIKTRSKTAQTQAIATGTNPDDDLEALIATRRRERLEKAAGFCPQCGKPIQLSDRFCPRCGATLSIDDQSLPS